MTQSTHPESSDVPKPTQQRISARHVASLPRRVAIAIVIAIALCGVIARLINQHDVWRGYVAASCVTVLAAIVSVRLLMRAMLGDPEKAIMVFMVATGVRMVISVGGCIVLVLAMGYPLHPTMLFMLVLYVAVLAAETSAVFAILKRKNH